MWDSAGLNPSERNVEVPHLINHLCNDKRHGRAKYS